jgi:hypothetical protein
MTKKEIIARVLGNARKPEEFKPTTMAVAFVMAVVNDSKE